MLTKENVKEMSKNQIDESFHQIEDKINHHLRFLRGAQLRIHRNPAQYEDKVDGIMKELKELRGDLSVLHSMKNLPISYEQVEECRKQIDCANGIINTCFYKYWQKVAPLREFKKEVEKVRCEADDGPAYTLYKALLAVSDIYESMESLQKSVTLLCKRAQTNTPGDNWYDEACRARDLIQKSIEEISFTGTFTLDNEYITHTIYEVMVYEFTVMTAKLDRYIKPRILKECRDPNRMMPIYKYTMGS